MNPIKQIYKAVIPESIRLKLYVKRIKRFEDSQKQEVLKYYKENPSEDLEILDALEFLENNPITPLPYPFLLPYLSKKVDVYIDQTNNLPYVMHGTHRLYFKKSWKPEGIINSYRMLLAEQDPTSPHRYLTNDYPIDENSVVVDVGAAEGIFALHEMEKISHLYMIEADPEWVEALNATYAPWAHKITILSKFVSNKDDVRNVRLDTYFSNNETIDFLKIDVDGAEQDLLNGASEVIDNQVKKMIICTYHKTNDNKEFTEYLEKKQYHLHNSEKYLLFHYDTNFTPPYFRRALLRAKKNI